MKVNELRYKMYLKRSVLQAHTAALDDTIYQIETQSDKPTQPTLDQHKIDEENFIKCLNLIEGLK